MTLHQAACEACDSCGAPSLGLMLATASFDAADLERLTEPHWSPGRCGISLLPLKRLPSAPRRSLDSHEQECLVSCLFACESTACPCGFSSIRVIGQPELGTSACCGSAARS